MPPEIPPASDGGEFALLLERLRHWWSEAQALQLWQQSRRPLTLLGSLVALLLLLHVTGALLDAIRGVPMLPGLLELISLIWFGRTGLPWLLGKRPG